MNNFVERIYKLYIDLGEISIDSAEKYCKKLLKQFKKIDFDQTKQKVFLISNRQGINDIKIITTYFDQDHNQYYTIEA